MRRNGYFWFRFGIVAGVCIGVTLLATSISTYWALSRKVSVESLRLEAAGRVSNLDRQLRTADLASSVQLTTLLHQTLADSQGRLSWIQIRDSTGTVVAQAGESGAPVFSIEQAAAKFRNRQPLYKLRSTQAGELLVEAFPIRLPRADRAVFHLAALSPGPGPMGVIEVASFFSARAASGPLLRTLIISASGALGLLACAVLMTLRFRSHLAAKKTALQLEIARRVQQDLLPLPEVLSRHFELAADWQTAARVGGDFYDAFEVPGHGCALVFGDVAGKDIPAAMLTGVIHGAVRSSSWTRSATEHNEATRQLNRLLFERASRERFVSMVWSYFDPQTELLHYVNAGHCPPLLFRAGRRGPSPLRLTEGGPVLGLLADAKFEQGVEHLEPGDVVVFYSDGIVEASALGGEEFGEQRLAAVIERSLGGDTREIKDTILASLRSFTKRGKLEDDQTLVVVRYQPQLASQVEASAVALAA